MKNFAVVGLYKDSTETHLFCIKAYSGSEAIAIAKVRYMDNYEFVLPAKQMIETEEVVFRVYEIKEEDFK
jgi:hypothetical protein